MAPITEGVNVPTRCEVAHLAARLLLFDVAMWLFALIACDHGLARTIRLVDAGIGLLATNVWPLSP